ncbi:MAG TPA: ATP-dependent DNA helicase [Acidimicrobiaceae bacterium]|nr:ATP-dependent DNA helicase [Acidimicrobiaceae bacterium]
MAASARDRLLSCLTDAQRAAVTSEAPLLCVRAGAGSGKTTVLTRRVAWRVADEGIDPEHALVVTFTRKAALELRQRLGRLGVTGVSASTFHGAAYRELRRHWADRGTAAPTLVPEPERLLRRLLAEEPGAGPTTASGVAGELSWARARLIDPERYPEAASAARRNPPLPYEQTARLMARYADMKRRRGVIDLDDLVLRCATLLEEDPAWSAAVRWRLRHLFVDEFQDVNPAQWRLLEAWRHDRPDLCIVGDGRQAIYSWNGSDPSLIERIADLVPGTVVLRLDENHRSTERIVAAASAVLGPPDGEDVAPPGTSATAPLRVPSTAVDGPVPRLDGFEDEDAEAAAVVAWLRATRRPGHPWRHLAVLARTHARLEPVADALGAVGIPVRRPAATGRAPALVACLRTLRSVPRDTPLRAALTDAVADAGAGDHPEAPAGSASSCLELLAGLADEHAWQEAAPTVGSFLAWFTANRADTAWTGGDGVEVLSFHQAKGLEWPAVAVIGLEAGTMPIAYAVDDLAVAEERRLLYVAMTRAERHLWCSWAQRGRSAGSGAGARRRSPFLDDLPGALAGAAPLEAEAALAKVAGLRQRLAAVV